ncbi:hypothetical protein E2C01_085135 [Portunus trituberculatus]|uniref:Uncharacterized protein n=1 Tax=Portunus trituberculatus TaxID=210409 RepID=A0A5B7J1T3_PORTR|nr:hypothetical protein [Portunus trituberculatus]
MVVGMSVRRGGHFRSWWWTFLVVVVGIFGGGVGHVRSLWWALTVVVGMSVRCVTVLELLIHIANLAIDHYLHQL